MYFEIYEYFYYILSLNYAALHTLAFPAFALFKKIQEIKFNNEYSKCGRVQQKRNIKIRNERLIWSCHFAVHCVASPLSFCKYTFYIYNIFHISPSLGLLLLLYSMPQPLLDQPVAVIYTSLNGSGHYGLCTILAPFTLLILIKSYTGLFEGSNNMFVCFYC